MCIVTGAFHTPELDRRIKSTRKRPFDNDGMPIRWALNDYLEVAHILPHSLMTADWPDRPNPTGDDVVVSHLDPQLSERKRITLALLQVLCPTVLNLIDGPRIDSPANALLLCHSAHQRFSRFDIYFKPKGDASLNTYVVRAFKHSDALWLKSLDKSRVTRTGPYAGVNVRFHRRKRHRVPAFQLLELHGVIAKLIHMSVTRYVSTTSRSGLDGALLLDEEPEDFTYFTPFQIRRWLDGLTG